RLSDTRRRPRHQVSRRGIDHLGEPESRSKKGEPMGRLEGKVAIVTGASAGIGRATAILFAQEGAKVVVGARRGGELEELGAEIEELVAEMEAGGGAATALAGDVRSEGYAKALVETAASRFGRLDIAFNNAGTMGEAGPSTEVSEAGWTDTLATNLTSAFLGA